MSEPALKIPEGFKYMKAFLHGRPEHEPGDPFWIKHPPMELSRRAKIFAPFAALRGFDLAVTSFQEEWEPFRELGEDQAALLRRKLGILSSLLVRDSHAARENQVVITVTYYSPCDDPDSEFYGVYGKYLEKTGVLSVLDPVHHQLCVDDDWLDLDDICDIQDPDGCLFSSLEYDD